MKRFALVLCVLLMLCLLGCSTDGLPTYSGNNEHLIDTEYFTLTLPEDLQGKCEYNIENFEDGTYALTIYKKEGLKEHKEIFHIRLFPRYEVAEDYSLWHGILVTPNGDFQLASRFPDGYEFSPETYDVWDAFVDEFSRIGSGLEPKKGCDHLVPQPETKPVADHPIKTRYYTVTIPADWFSNCEWEIFPTDEEGPDALVLYELSSYKTEYGGHLFTILLIPHGEDYSYYPAYEWVGVLETPEGDLDIVVLYPTDVQFSEDTADTYNRMVQDVDDVIYSLQPNDGIGLVLP